MRRREAKYKKLVYAWSDVQAAQVKYIGQTGQIFLKPITKNTD